MAKAMWHGTVLSETNKYQIVEGNIYFPPDSVNWDYFKEGSRQYTCPWKGEAKYYDVIVDGETNKNSAWSYPDTKPAAKNIEGYVAFETEKGILVEK